MPRRSAASVDTLVQAVENISPFRLAAPWDNTGLLMGDRAAPLSRVWLTIDLTAAVLDETLRGSGRASTRGSARKRSAPSSSSAPSAPSIIAYHPPIFAPVKRLDADEPRAALLLRAARAGVSIISPHTALDAVAGGVCDWLAEGIGEGALAPLEPASELPRGEAFLVVTKLPRSAVEAVHHAMSLAGAGEIGAYSKCSFELAGHGTFHGAESSAPRVGRRGRLERAEESKLEMVSSARALPGVLSALRASHPYEEPPIEVVAMAARPSVREGHGRALSLMRPASLAEVSRRVNRHLALSKGALEVVDAGRARHARIGICPGSGGSMLGQAVDMGCTLFVTGEMKHHERLDALERGCSLILAGHTETERGYLPRYRAALKRELPGITIDIARSDRPPARRRA